MNGRALFILFVDLLKNKVIVHIEYQFTVLYGCSEQSLISTKDFLWLDLLFVLFICYTSHGALAGMTNRSMGPP